MHLQSVLFDLDGVLIDTEGEYTGFWSEMDRRFPTGVDRFAYVIKGSTLSRILTTYFPNPEFQAEILRLLTDFENNMDFRPYEGVRQLLQSLHDAGVKSAIVTSSNRAKMNRLLAMHPWLGQLIDTIVVDEDVSASKPDPQGYLLAASRLNSDPARCVVVEDSLSGLKAGRASGAVVVGIATTNPKDVVAQLADITYDSAGEISIETLDQRFNS